jgi:hypothetical protein
VVTETLTKKGNFFVAKIRRLKAHLAALKKSQKKSQLDGDSRSGTPYKIGHSFVMREISNSKMRRREIIGSIERKSMDKVGSLIASTQKCNAVRVVRKKLENRFKSHLPESTLVDSELIRIDQSDPLEKTYTRDLQLAGNNLKSLTRRSKANDGSFQGSKRNSLGDVTGGNLLLDGPVR